MEGRGTGRDEEEGMGGEESHGEGRKGHQEREGGKEEGRNERDRGRPKASEAAGRAGPGPVTFLERRPEYCSCPLTFHAFQCHHNGGVSGSGSATGELGHYGSHPRHQVADRGTPSRMDKRVAPDKEGAADKQCLRKRKTLIPNRSRWSSLSLFMQIHLGEGKL